MTHTVVHPQRVAWDAARAFVRAAYSPHYPEFAGRVQQNLGPEIFAELQITRNKLEDWMRRPPADRYMFDLEAGKWRIRIQELIAARPDLIGAIQDLST